MGEIILVGPGGPDIIIRVLVREEVIWIGEAEKEETMLQLLSLKMEGEVMNLGMEAISRSWNTQGNKFFPRVRSKAGPWTRVSLLTSGTVG